MQVSRTGRAANAWARRCCSAPRGAKSKRTVSAAAESLRPCRALERCAGIDADSAFLQERAAYRYFLRPGRGVMLAIGRHRFRFPTNHSGAWRWSDTVKRLTKVTLCRRMTMTISKFTTQEAAGAQVVSLLNSSSPERFDSRRLTVSRGALSGGEGSAPCIRLLGRWLEQAGFTIGSTVDVSVARGRLVIDTAPSVVKRKRRLPRRRHTGASL